MFGKKKEIKYGVNELWMVKFIMGNQQRIQEFCFRSDLSEKDCLIGIKKCEKTLQDIDEFEQRNPELKHMFNFERELVATYKKSFGLKMEEMEKSAV